MDEKYLIGGIDFLSDTFFSWNSMAFNRVVKPEIFSSGSLKLIHKNIYILVIDTYVVKLNCIRLFFIYRLNPSSEKAARNFNPERTI